MVSGTGEVSVTEPSRFLGVLNTRTSVIRLRLVRSRTLKRLQLIWGVKPAQVVTALRSLLMGWQYIFIVPFLQSHSPILGRASRIPPRGKEVEVT